LRRTEYDVPEPVLAPTPAYIHASSCGILGERAAHIAAQLSIHPLYSILFFDIRQCIASLFMPYSYIIQTFYVAQMDCVHFREAAAAGFFVQMYYVHLHEGA
jgi:hypothetical protein